MILTRLRESTRCLHERVEKALDLNKRLESNDAYAKMLARFYGLYCPLERSLEDMALKISWGFNLQSRWKTPLVARDLGVLGWTEREVSDIAQCPRIPSITNPSQAFGCLYVLEGSTLGGQLIKRLVQERLGINSETGCAFFTGYGDSTGEMWKEFCTSLNSHAVSSPATNEMIVSAAGETFARFEEWFSC